MKLTLKKKFLVPTTALVVVGMLVVMIMSFTGFRTAITEAIEDDISHKAHSTVEHLDSWVVRNRKCVETWSTNGLYARAVNDESARPAASERLALYRKGYPFLENIILADGSGALVASAQGAMGNINVAGLEFFREAMNGRTFISEAMASKETGEPVFVIAAPVKDNGRTVGVFFTPISLSSFSKQFINPITVGEHGYAFMVNEEGLCVAAPDPAHVLKFSVAGEDYFARSLTVDRGIARYSYKGNAQMVAFEHVPSTGWILGVVTMEDEMLAPVHAMGVKIAVVGLLVSLLVLGLLAILLRRVVIRPIGEVVDGLRDAAEGEGDLTKRLRVGSEDEIGELGHWFNVFMENLETVVSRVKQSAVQVESATGEVSTGSQGLSQSSQEQASAIEEVAATIEQMSATIKQNAENAENGRRQMQEMVQLADSSEKVAGELIKSMEEISTSSGRIGEIIDTVNEVAFQTNLLALNAAVEAARAGEHGKGFAVVAEEVRALAQRSADSTKEIRDLVEDDRQKIGGGETMVQQTGSALKDIIGRINGLSQTMEELAAASAEQATGVDEVNRAIGQIDAATQQNASTVEELAGTSENLSSEARDMSETMGRFRVSTEADGASAARPAPAAAAPVRTRAAATDSGFDEGFEEF